MTTMSTSTPAATNAPGMHARCPRDRRQEDRQRIVGRLTLGKCASAVLPNESEIILDKFAVLD